MFRIPGINIQAPPAAVNHNPVDKRSFSEIVKGGLHTICNIPSKISHTCAALYNSPPAKACRILGIPNMNITQCGPQCHVRGYDLKFTPTTICTTKSIGCFPGHGEVGYYIGKISIFNAYFLSVHQYGFKIEHNGSVVPRNWECSAVAEKLEHQEVTIPYLKFGDNTVYNGNYRGSVQFLMAIECGKTTTIPASEIREKMKDLFCNTPTAFPELIYQVCKNHWKENNNNQPSVITEQPRTKKFPAEFPPPPPLPGEEEKQITGSKDETFWFGVTIGPGDLNSAITWGSKDFSFSFQITDYWRKTFMFRWINGKFYPPENIAELIEIMTVLCLSHGKSSQQINDIIAQTTSALTNMQPDESMRHQTAISMTELGQTLQDALSKNREANQPPLPDLLTQARQADNIPTVFAEISHEQQQEENTDEVMLSDIRPRTKSQLRKRTRSVLDISEVNVTLPIPSEEDHRQRSSSLIVKDPQRATKPAKNRDNIVSTAADDAFRPRSRTMEIKRHRLPSEHSD